MSDQPLREAVAALPDGLRKGDVRRDDVLALIERREAALLERVATTIEARRLSPGSELSDRETYTFNEGVAAGLAAVRGLGDTL